MAGSVNKVILIGHLGRDPEVRSTKNGNQVASFSVATTESWRDKASGERKDRTEWHNVVIWNENLAKIAEQYCKKGSKVYVEGQLQTREYEDKDGNQRKVTEVVLQGFNGQLTLLDSLSDGDRRGGRRDDADDDRNDRGGGYSRGRDEGRTRSQGASRTTSSRRAEAPIDDDIPF